MWCLVTSFSLLIIAVASQDEVIQSPIVNITQGTVLGLFADDGNYFQFYGIPYAGSVSGNNRFKAPSSANNFEETFVANRSDIKCIRALKTGYEGVEDCLVANVFTPSLNESSLLPVMVWIKGNEFDKADEQNLSFRKIVEQQVIVVSLNFRESVFGFLCLGIEEAPGNAGLKDIIAGLKWVQENIIYFGGNPESVTLFGHGSGAAAVDLVTLSSSATNLVHRAIAQSGSALASWAVTRNNIKNARQIAESLNYTISSVPDISQAFLETSVENLMAEINALDLTDNSMAFGPCVENENLISEETFLSKSPYQIIINGEFLNIPFITGTVDNEGTIRSDETYEDNWLERMNSSFVDFIQSDLQFVNSADKQFTSERIKLFYVGLPDEENNNALTLENFIDYHGDTMILVPAIREVQLRSIFADNVYMYQFSYKGSLGEPLESSIEVESAAHRGELAYLFPGLANDDMNSTMDATMSDILIERWTNFAKYGIPSSVTSDTVWYPYSLQLPHILRVLNANEIDIQYEISVLNPYVTKFPFWNAIYNEHYLDAESQWELTDIGDGDEDDSGEREEVNIEDDNPEFITVNPDTTTYTVDDVQVVNPETTTEYQLSTSEDYPSTSEDYPTTIEDMPDSSSTAVAYTFTIFILFSLLQKFHTSMLLF